MTFMEEALEEFKKANGIVNFDSFIGGAKWMAERLEREFNPDPALTGKKSHISQRINELSKELS